MDVSPGDPGTRHFDNTVQYVFHVSSTSDNRLAPTRTATNVICTFASDTDAQCWVGDKDYVNGDPSSDGGMTSADGKMKVFAGRRADPFFFNLNGFKAVTAFVGANAGGLMPDAAGCPQLVAAQGSALRGMLTEGPQGSGSGNHVPCSGSSANCFEDLERHVPRGAGRRDAAQRGYEQGARGVG